MTSSSPGTSVSRHNKDRERHGEVVSIAAVLCAPVRSLRLSGVHVDAAQQRTKMVENLLRWIRGGQPLLCGLGFLELAQ